MGKVQTKKLEMARLEAVSDELSTIPGATVTVTPGGNITVKRVVGNTLYNYFKSYIIYLYRYQVN